MNDKTPNAFLPITVKTKHKCILGRLECRANCPDLWTAHWRDEPQAFMIHNRISRLIWIFYCQWPNAFFIPEDDIYTMLDSGHFESLDQVEFIMTLEEIYNIKIDDEIARKIFPSPGGKDPTTYKRFLTAMLDVFGPDKELTGIAYEWAPLCLPPDYFDQSAWQSIKRYLPFTWSDHSLYRDLRRLQLTRPKKSLENQWAEYDDGLIQLRDKIGRILVDELEWFDDAFIPQDRLEAVFHSRCGPEFAAKVLDKINKHFDSDVEFDFIVSRRHTYADFLKKVTKAS